MTRPVLVLLTLLLCAASAGAVISLHSVTALPIAIRREARVGDATIALAPRGGGVRADGDCWVFEESADRYELAVTSPQPAPAARTAITLQTCPPRIGATPERVLTNPVTRRGPGLR